MSKPSRPKRSANTITITCRTKQEAIASGSTRTEPRSEIVNSTQKPMWLLGRFFFTPTDPTTLGFMRIIAGLVIIYTHCAYFNDLSNFLGPDAWSNQKLANQQRRV